MIRPSRILMTRLAQAAMSSSCVTMMIVLPESFSFSSTSMISWLVWCRGSRRLVGQDDVRVVDQRPGDRDALLLAAGELRGPVVEPIAQADQAGHFDRPLLGLRADLAGSLVGERKLDVLEHRVLLDQVIRLEDEAKVTAADLGELVVVEAGDVAAAQVVRPLVGRSRQPSKLSMVLLPEPEAPMMAMYSPG